MPKSNQALKSPDPIVMTPDDINEALCTYLSANGFSIRRGHDHSEMDIRAVRGKVELFIESRGNQAFKNKGTDLVFDSSQIDNHLSEHISQIMRFQQSISSPYEKIFIMANPYIPRIVERVHKLNKGLDKLGIIRGWIFKEGSITFEADQNLLTKIEGIFDK
ncbi:hypothetical protein [Fictibacillus barbaricus]|uniref:Uncharacterized protein n=1 Tax=Fictibacillus barbaricus TaxID=182136 RepID=A0ABU1U425_9BACL|nr:hypothetical protein [Fictibacillus barbaricus]MDR7074187.1 hypothetical protein [Fictibacillus barbaricus]